MVIIVRVYKIWIIELSAKFIGKHGGIIVYNNSPYLNNFLVSLSAIFPLFADRNLPERKTIVKFKCFIDVTVIYKWKSECQISHGVYKKIVSKNEKSGNWSVFILFLEITSITGYNELYTSVM